MFLYLLTFLKNNKGILKSNTILEYVYSYCTGATTDISEAPENVKHY